MFFIGRTRFSLFVPTSASWRLTLAHGGNPEDSYRKELYDDERLRIREEIFTKHTLPSLALAAAEHDVTHVVSYSESLPAKYKESLANEAEKYPFLLLDEQPDGKIGQSLLAIAKKKAEPGEVFGQYRLDDDDVLATDYFDRMAKFIRPSYTGMVVSFPLGIESILDNGQVFNLKSAHFPMNSMGLMYVCRMNNQGRIIAPKNGAHNMADRDNAVIIDSREIGYFRFNHVGQDNALKMSNGPSLQMLRKQMERYPDFEDHEKLAKLFPTIPQIIGAEEEVDLLPEVQKVRTPFNVPLEVPVGTVTLEVKHSFPEDSKARKALVTLEIVDLEGNAVSEQTAFPGIPRSTKKSIGHYKYLNSVSGEGTTKIDVSLPDGYRLKSFTLRRFGLRSKPFHVNAITARYPKGENPTQL